MAGERKRRSATHAKRCARNRRRWRKHTIWNLAKPLECGADRRFRSLSYLKIVDHPRAGFPLSVYSVYSVYSVVAFDLELAA